MQFSSLQINMASISPFNSALRLLLLLQILPGGFPKIGDDPWYKRSKNYWSLDTIESNKRLLDVIGSSDSKVLGGADVVQGISKQALRLDGDFSTGADLGNFSKSCLSEPERCDKGFTITFWMKLDSSDLEGADSVLQISTNRYSIGTTLYAKINKIGFSVNTKNTTRNVETSWKFKDWMHVTLLWNNSGGSVDILYNCKKVPYLRNTKRQNTLRMVPPQQRLMLGANYGFLMNSRVIIDELAIWYDVLPQDEVCYIKTAKAVDGGFTEWSNYTSCTVTCGRGRKARTRTCTNPAPQHGGLSCSVIGTFREKIECFPRHCPIDGNYTAWSAYTPCTKSCGGGTRYRSRTCSNPMPIHGGLNCSRYGEPLDTIACNTQHCPIDGGYSGWSSFSKCSVSCGGGFKTRNRTCTSPIPRHGGQDCSGLGASSENKFCYLQICPVDGVYSKWSTFTTCSKTCGNGTQTRTRKCDNPVPVGDGRNCSRLGPPLETKSCNTNMCPVNGGYTSWSNASVCTKTCDGGTQSRMRNCTNPPPEYGGLDCTHLGLPREMTPCNAHPCPVHGRYGTWTRFGRCSATCGGGEKLRKRYCDSPIPLHGGRNCSGLGPAVQFKPCNQKKCPDITFIATVNFRGEKFKATLYLRNSEDFISLTEKITWNTRKIYDYDSALEDVIVSFCDSEESVKGIQCVLEFRFRSKGFNGIIKLQDALLRKKLLFQMPVKSYFISSNDVPSHFPTNITVFNTSSRSLKVTWIQSDKSAIEGVEGYRLMYRDEEGNVYNKIVSGMKTNRTVLRGLQIYHNYCVRIMAFGRRGDGLASDPVCAYTDQGVPDGVPEGIKASSPSSTTIKITWNTVDKKFVHGQLLGYGLIYRRLNYTNPANISNSSHHNILKTKPNATKVIITGLEIFTEYGIKIAVYNQKGIGVWSNELVVRTSEDVPRKPPEIISVLNTSSTTLNVTWRPIPKKFLGGRLLGYRVFYKDIASRYMGDWKTISVEPGTHTATLVGLRKFGTQAVQVAGYTGAGEGLPSKRVLVATNEDVPSLPPQNMTVANTSSTSLLVQWSPVPKEHHNGVIQGYKILYKVSGRNDSFFTKYAILDTIAVEIMKLTKFTAYDVSMAAYTSKGDGVRTNEVTVSTAEDIPSKPPQLLSLYNTSSTSLHIIWHRIPMEYIHGILQGYRVLYRTMNGTRDSYKFLELEPQTLKTDLVELLKYTEYGVRVLGFTVVGHGAVSEEVIIRTDQDVPSWPPEHVTATNKSSPTMISVKWQPISDEYYIHGILLGYKVSYRAVRNPNEILNGEQNSVVVGLNSLSVVLKGLSPFTIYAVQVLAYTSKGNGTSSPVVPTETCNCHKTLYTNWWINPPYLDVNNTGIFPPILEMATDQCCGNCAEHGRSFIDFTSTGDKMSSYKESDTMVKKSIDENTELSFPVYGRTDLAEYDGFGFVAVVESGGVIFITTGQEPGATARMLVYSVFDLWPLCMVVFVSAFFAGILMWMLDSFFNSKQFPKSPFRGPIEGMWWAFITMTTLGYGDRIPKAFHSKIFCVFWITSGLVIVSLFMSFITTTLTTEIMASEIMVYGSKVAAIQNSSEFRLGIRMNARFDPDVTYNNLMDIYKALKTRQVDGALIDTYTVSSRQDLFGDPTLRVVKNINHASSSYGVVLAGDARKLRICYKYFLKEERAKVFKAIEDNVRPLEGIGTGGVQDMTGNLFDAESGVFQQAIIWSSVILGVLTVICLVYELMTRKKREASPGRFDYSHTAKLVKNSNTFSLQYEEQREEMREVVQEFYTNCRTRTAQLTAKHRRELRLLYRMKEGELTGNNEQEESNKGKSLKQARLSLLRFIYGVLP